MKSLLKSIVTQGGVYGLGRILVRAVGFLMIPVYTHRLTPADYGILELLDLFLTVFGLFVANGVNSAIFKFYYSCEDPKEKGRVVSTAIWCVLAATIVLVMGVLPNVTRISSMLFGVADNGRYVSLALAPFVFNLLGDIPLGYLRAQQKAVTYTAVALARVVVDLGLVLFFLVYLKWGVTGILTSQAISASCFTVFLLARTIKVTGFSFSRPMARRILRFGIPLIPSSIGMFIINNGDRFFLKHFGSLEDVGIYSLGYKFGYMVSFLILQPFMLIWDAKLYEIAKQTDAPKTFGKIFTYLVLLLLFAALGLAMLIKPLIMVIADKAFWPAAAIAPLVVFAYVFQGFYYFFQGGLYLRGKTEYIGAIIFGTSAITIMLYYFLIRSRLSMGAAEATLISFIVMSAAMFVVSQKIYPIIYEYRRIFVLFVSAGLILGLRSAHIFVIPWVNTAYSILLEILFPISLFLLGFFTPDEKQLVFALFSKPLNSRK